MQAVSEMTFEEISICLEDFSSFSQSCKEFHDASGVNLNLALLNVCVMNFFHMCKTKKLLTWKRFFLLGI